MTGVDSSVPAASLGAVELRAMEITDIPALAALMRRHDGWIGAYKASPPDNAVGAAQLLTWQLARHLKGAGWYGVIVEDGEVRGQAALIPMPREAGAAAPGDAPAAGGVAAESAPAEGGVAAERPHVHWDAPTVGSGAPAQGDVAEEDAAARGDCAARRDAAEEPHAPWEVVLWVEPGAGGRGLGRMAVEALCEVGFGELGLPAVHARAQRDNARSRAIFRRLGFEQVSTERGWARLRLNRPATG